MQLFDHAEIDARLDWAGLIEELRANFAAARTVAPVRQVLEIDLPNGDKATLLIMPAWEGGRAIGVKVVTFFPGNTARGKPTISAGMLMFDGADGQFTAALDGDALTARRTAAASALAADYLARKDVQTLFVVGTGQLALSVAQAHASVRAYTRVLIWGRSGEKARSLAAALVGRGLPAENCEDIESGCRLADVISSVTASTMPIIRGGWLREGSHLDLIGAFKADMRESDTAAITGARVFVDGRAGAILAGDLAQPIAEGAFLAEDIVADLTELAQGHPVRLNEISRTVFKSAGLSQEDLAAAMKVVRR
ncbi:MULTISPECIES: ornithine cyclodeaminase family protein [Mesorhizobium]|uniref:ornithine cyclodeaminase family protein n=1 Tax=Mesorhizobium TaxID=68287 RepID=UPI0007ECE42B|nr:MULTISPECIES: ornithine cyclodeaminase family protein [Mesorhizobium]PBB51908.1 ornithine cyclodeaminase [Mesorhizobium loti]QIA25249.1 ornithine cyclodeaminase family protein [Mesorhizobium sp. AA22]